MFGLQIIINTVLLCGGDSPVISWPWWLNIGGSRLEQYFTVLEVAAPPELHAIATESSESVREGFFPKPSCYISDFLIRLDSWLHCTVFGWNSARLKSCTFELFMCTVQGGIAGNFCLCMAFVYLAAQTAIQQMFKPWNVFLFFYIWSGSVCFWHTLQDAGLHVVPLFNFGVCWIAGGVSLTKKAHIYVV